MKRANGTSNSKFAPEKVMKYSSLLPGKKPQEKRAKSIIGLELFKIQKEEATCWTQKKTENMPTQKVHSQEK